MRRIALIKNREWIVEVLASDGLLATQAKAFEDSMAFGVGTYCVAVDDFVFRPYRPDLPN